MEKKQGSPSGLTQFRDTAIAFDNLIVQVGRGLARAQEAMDLSQIEFQRSVAKALAEGRMRQLDVNPANAYSIPETHLQLKVGMSMHYPEGATTPAVTAVPLNASTANQNDIDVEAATAVNLRFVTVPQNKDVPAAAPSALSLEEVRVLVESDQRVAAILSGLKNFSVQLDYDEQSRLWTLAYVQAKEPVLMVVINDRSGDIGSVIYQPLLVSDTALEPVGVPELEAVEPQAGRQGDILMLRGDNFLTLGGQTLLTVDGRAIPVVSHSMQHIAFKVPGWAVNGDVEVITPLGSTAETGRAFFTPVPSVESFDPHRGYYNALTHKGSWLSFKGNNLREGCGIRFASGAISHNIKVLSPGLMQVEVPAEAASGPVTLVWEQFEQILPDDFIMLPRVARVSPRQARVGDEINISGNTLEGVTELAIGGAVVPRASFTLQISQHIRFLLPPGAFDGRIKVRQSLGVDEIAEAVSRDIFYVVPRITGFAQRIVSAGQLLTIYGEGLDPQDDMMTLLFEARGGISEAPVLSVSSDRQSLTTRVPMDAVTGYVTLLRKRIYSDFSPADTSNMSLNKLTVMTLDGAPADFLLEERFDAGLAAWKAEAGKWSIDQGMLAASETARLGYTLAEPCDQLAVYADVLNAERFGLSLTPDDGGPPLQVWVDLLASTPAVTWSSLDARGRSKTLDGLPLALLPGGHHLLRITLKAGRVSLWLDQREVHGCDWGAVSISTVALLSDSANQHWDNVIILKGEYLSLPAADYYRFGEVPVTPVLPELAITSFSPAKGDAGTEVLIKGTGLDAATRFFFSGKEATVKSVSGKQARVVVPAGARTGAIEVHGRGGTIVSSGDKPFVLPPAITQLTPRPVLAGEHLKVLGTNLPAVDDRFNVTVLGKTAEVVSATPSMLTVLVPDVSGEGVVQLSYKGFTAVASDILEVRRETLVLDLLAAASEATWSTAAGVFGFGGLGERGAASVQLRDREHMEDDRLYEPVIYLHPPQPAYRALRGEYPLINVPQGRLELHIDFGMLWSAAPATDEVTEADGVIFEVLFEDSGSGEEISLLPRTACVHDGFLERFTIDADAIAGKTGRLVLSVYPGRNGLRDDAALVSGMLILLN